MEGVLREWITSLTALAVIAALVDILLPEGAFKKYTGFIFGLIVMILILQPMLRAFGSIGNLKESLSAYSALDETANAEVMSARLSDLKRRQLAANLEEKLETRVKAHLEQFTQARKLTAEITFRSENGRLLPGVIERVDLTVTEYDTHIRIEPVIVCTDDAGALGGEQSLAEKPHLRQIRSAAAALLEISEAKIHIHENNR